MTGESYFMLMGSLGVTLAGFAGLISVVGSRGRALGAVERWRVRHIVTRGFAVSVVALSTILAFSATGRVDMTVRIATALLLLARWSLWSQSRPGPAWPNEQTRRRVRGNWLFNIALVASNIFFASVPVLQGLLLLELVSPMIVFVRAVLDESDEHIAQTTGAPNQPPSPPDMGVRSTPH